MHFLFTTLILDYLNTISILDEKVTPITNLATIWIIKGRKRNFKVEGVP